MTSSRTIDHHIPPSTYMEDGVRLNLACSLRIALEDSMLLDDMVVIRGAGLCLKIRLRWNDVKLDETVTEAFGRLVAKAEMWEQLLFKTSLQIFDNSEWDIVLELSRLTTSVSEGNTEQLISTALPTAKLVCVSMEFKFSGSIEGLVSVSLIMPLADTAIRHVWHDGIAVVAPLCAYPGYLREVNEKVHYIGLIAEAIGNITGRMRVEKTDYSKELWKVLMKGLEAKKRGRLKSLTAGDSDEVFELDESSMLFDEPEPEEEEEEEEEEDLFMFGEEEGEDCFLDSFGTGSVYSRSSSEILGFMDEQDEQDELLLQAEKDSWI